MSAPRLSDEQRAACVALAEERSTLSREGVDVIGRGGEVWHYVHPRFADAYADAAFALAEAEVIRLRAALAEIAALQTEEPAGDHTDDNLDYAYELGTERGLYTASQIARAALGGGT